MFLLIILAVKDLTLGVKGWEIVESFDVLSAWLLQCHPIAMS
jgi:hypothetical protein